jgi:Na+-transporting NADH:ubiquinone oxidoreductase subunit NqrB
MKPLLTALMLGNAVLFVFGALQHAGVAIGPLREPVIVPASVVEVLCALALGWGAAAVLKQSLKAWRAAFIGNLVAIIGVVIGMVALAMGGGPRTASNDLYHRIMLALATASLVILVVPAGRTALRRN